MFSLWFLTWKTKIDITNVLWYPPNWLDIPQLAPGVSCLSSVSGCALAVVTRGLAIRTHWPFTGKMWTLKETEGGTRKREGSEPREVLLCIRILMLIKLMHNERETRQVETLRSFYLSREQTPLFSLPLRPSISPQINLFQYQLKISPTLLWLRKLNKV